jgi:hypothetical protein
MGIDEDMKKHTEEQSAAFVHDGYGDILNHPHHVSTHHPQMPISARAAQFSPFAALTGYGNVVKETARLTDREIILSEDEMAELDFRLSLACGMQGAVLLSKSPISYRMRKKTEGYTGLSQDGYKSK